MLLLSIWFSTWMPREHLSLAPRTLGCHGLSGVSTTTGFLTYLCVTTAWTARPVSFTVSSVVSVFYGEFIAVCSFDWGLRDPHLWGWAFWRIGTVNLPSGRLEKTTRSSPHHVAQHHPTGSETTPPCAPRSSRFGSEPPSVDDDVDVWRYAIVSCTPETTTTNSFVWTWFRTLLVTHKRPTDTFLWPRIMSVKSWCHLPQYGRFVCC